MGGGGGKEGLYIVNGQPTVPLCEYGIFMGDSQGPGGGGLAHLPNRKGVVILHSLTTASPPRSQTPLPLSLDPSFTAPSPLTVLPLCLPLCAPSHPLQIVEGPYLGEGVIVIRALHVPFRSSKYGRNLIQTHIVCPFLVHLIMETYGDFSDFHIQETLNFRKMQVTLLSH